MNFCGNPGPEVIEISGETCRGMPCTCRWNVFDRNSENIRWEMYSLINTGFAECINFMYIDGCKRYLVNVYANFIRCNLYVS